MVLQRKQFHLNGSELRCCVIGRRPSFRCVLVWAMSKTAFISLIHGRTVSKTHRWVEVVPWKLVCMQSRVITWTWRVLFLAERACGDCWCPLDFVASRVSCDLFAMGLISVKMSHSWRAGTLLPSQCVAVSHLVRLWDFKKLFMCFVISPTWLQFARNEPKSWECEDSFFFFFLCRKWISLLAHWSKNTFTVNGLSFSLFCFFYWCC